MAGTMFENWPPQLVQAFIILVVGALGTLGLVLTALGLYIRSSLKTSASKQATELAITKTSFEFVAGEAKRLSERQDTLSETITRLREEKASDSTKIQMLSDQLQESRQHSRDRDVKLGELQAKHDQAVEDRKTFEARVKEVIEERKAIESRVKELETRQAERHEAAEKMQLRIGQIENERNQAMADLRSANGRIAELQQSIKDRDERIVAFETEIALLKAGADKLLTPSAPAPTENAA